MGERCLREQPYFFVLNMDNVLTFHGLPNDVHHCTSRRIGNVITWRCPLCEGYERRFDLLTGVMTVTGKTGAKHIGISSKPENMEASILNYILN